MKTVHKKIVGVAILVIITSLISNCATTPISSKDVDSRSVDFLFSDRPREFTYPRDPYLTDQLLWNSYYDVREKMAHDFGHRDHHEQAVIVARVWRSIDELRGTTQPTPLRKHVIKQLRKKHVVDSAIGVAETVLLDLEIHYSGALRPGYGIE